MQSWNHTPGGNKIQFYTFRKPLSTTTEVKQFVCFFVGTTNSCATYLVYLELLVHIHKQLIIKTIPPQMLSLGRHCCLWCLIRTDQLKLPPSQCGSVETRTTDSIMRDYHNFVENGGNIKNAKLYNNVICKPFFPSIDLSQVKKPTTSTYTHQN